MPVLEAVGGDVAPLYGAAFVVYWCYGTQLSAAARDKAEKTGQEACPTGPCAYTP